jgi:hypothetical protein
MFEPVHGSAPDIAGRGIANPMGAIWTAAMLLAHLGHAEAAARVESAIAAVFAKTADAEAAAGRRVTVPLPALWGERRFVGRGYDVLDVWRGYATDVRGRALASDHYLPEEVPADVTRELAEFFG